jgi:hypothetical protein
MGNAGILPPLRTVLSNQPTTFLVRSRHKVDISLLMSYKVQLYKFLIYCDILMLEDCVPCDQAEPPKKEKSHC